MNTQKEREQWEAILTEEARPIDNPCTCILVIKLERCVVLAILKRILKFQPKGTRAVAQVNLVDRPNFPRVDLSEFRISGDISYKFSFADVHFATHDNKCLSFVLFSTKIRERLDKSTLRGQLSQKYHFFCKDSPLFT